MTLLLYGALIITQIGICAKQFAMKKCAERAKGGFNSLCINLARSAICLLVSLIIWLVTDGAGTNTLGLALSIGAGVGTALNLYTWILSAQRVSLILIEGASTVGGLILPLIFAPFLYNGDSVSVLQWVGTALVVISIFLFSKSGAKKAEKSGVLGSIILVSVCALGGAVSSVFRKLYSFHIAEKALGSIEFFTFISFVAVFLLFALVFPFYYGKEKQKITAEEKGGRVELPYKRVWLFILIAAISLYACELFSSYASALPSAVYYPVSRALTILGTFLLDTLVFKEKVTPKNLAGLALLLTAVVLINL